MSLAGSAQAGAQANKVTAIREEGALAPSSENCSCPCPREASARVQIPSTVLERHKGGWGLSKALSLVGLALHWWRVLQQHR